MSKLKDDQNEKIVTDEKFNFERLKTECKSLNSTGLVKKKVPVVGVTKVAMVNSFIMAVESISPKDEDDIPPSIATLYNEYVDILEKDADVDVEEEVDEEEVEEVKPKTKAAKKTKDVEVEEAEAKEEEDLDADDEDLDEEDAEIDEAEEEVEGEDEEEIKSKTKAATKTKESKFNFKKNSRPFAMYCAINDGKSLEQILKSKKIREKYNEKDLWIKNDFNNITERIKGKG